MTTRGIGQWLTMVALFASLLVPSVPARADTMLAVNSSDDPATGTAAHCATPNAGTCTLRDAVAAANATTGATITISTALTAAITLASPLAVSSAMTIQGGGELRTRIVATSMSNDLFDVSASGPVVFIGMAIASGKNGISITGTGGVTVTACSLIFNANAGLFNGAAGTVIVTGSSLSANGRGLANVELGTAQVADSAFVQNANAAAASGGGGIVNNGTITMTNSTLTQNSSDGKGGGIYSYLGTVTVTNSTFTGNSASNGGGIAIVGATATVTNSTLAGNSATTAGGGVYNQGTLTVTNSTIAGNAASPSFGGGIADGTINATNTLIVDNTGSGDVDTSLATNSHNRTGAFIFADPDPKMPQDHGGPTKTLALPAGSPAIGAGDPAACAAAPVGGMDQRGIPRPATVCDIGAYETPGKTLAVTSTGPSPSGNVPVTVIATDGFGGAMPGYRGAVHVASTDPAGASADYQFTATDAGRHTFPALFATAGDWTVTATDTALTGRGTAHIPVLVASVGPSSGDVGGGGTVAIAGTNFGADRLGIGVTFGTKAAMVEQVTSTTITVRVPAHAAGTVDVTVTVNGVSGRGTGVYTYGVAQPLPSPQPPAGSGASVSPLPLSRPTGPPLVPPPNPLPPPR
ncbi:MAG: choice-of-anchor Q domain-containing protein [Thermomicrobiales bacterium]